MAIWEQNSFIFRYFLLYIVSGFNVLIKFKNKMNFGEVQESNSNLMYNNTDTSITKRKDPKTMSLSELDEYINKNRSRMMTETNNKFKKEKGHHKPSSFINDFPSSLHPLPKELSSPALRTEIQVQKINFAFTCKIDREYPLYKTKNKRKDPCH